MLSTNDRSYLGPKYNGNYLMSIINLSAYSKKNFLDVYMVLTHAKETKKTVYIILGFFKERQTQAAFRGFVCMFEIFKLQETVHLISGFLRKERHGVLWEICLLKIFVEAIVHIFTSSTPFYLKENIICNSYDKSFSMDKYE